MPNAIGLPIDGREKTSKIPSWPGIDPAIHVVKPASVRGGFMRIAMDDREDSKDDPLYRAAIEVETDERLSAEMTEWDGTVADGLDGGAIAAKRRCGPWTRPV
jgi:hypothetical protein